MNARTQNNGADSCPNAEYVRRACTSPADDQLLAHIELHVESCAACSELVATLTDAEDASDAMLQALSSLPASAADELAFQELQSTLLTMSPAGAGAARRLADPPIGVLPQKLGNYELQECIGRGAWGAIYRARHLKLDQIVAVKVLDSTRLHLAPALEHFVQEMKAVGQLNHPNIVRASDAGEDRGFHYLVMEYIDGVDAARLLRREQPLAVADACEIVRQAAVALDFAHRRSWVHRDVKPSNLMITSAGDVKLLDLGIAGRRDADQAPCKDRSPLGTEQYMAPEQWTRFASVDARADVYSLGCTLFKLLTGRSPQSNRSLVVDSPRDAAAGSSIAPVRADVRRGLERVLQQMLAADPNDRYQTAEEAAKALQPWTRRADLQALVARGRPPGDADRQPVPATLAASRSSHRPTRRRILFGAASLAGAGLSVFWLFDRRRPRLRRSHWRPLQPRSPNVLLSVDGVEHISVDFDDPTAVAVRSTNVALINLGRAVVGPFAIRASIVHEDGQGGAGVYFRWRQVSREPLVVDWQSIELASDQEDAQQVVGRLVWNHWTAERVERSVKLSQSILAEAILNANAVPERQELEATLGRHSMPNVVCNGQSVPTNAWTLSTAGRRIANIEPDRLAHEFLGGLGLINVGGATSFLTPELAYL